MGRMFLLTLAIVFSTPHLFSRQPPPEEMEQPEPYPPPPRKVVASDLAYALDMVRTPPGVDYPTPTADRWPDIQAAVHKAGVDLEVLDPREIRYMFSRVEDFQGDLRILRNRYEELKDAPPVASSERFPDSDTINEAIRFNRAHRKWLEGRTIWEADRAELYKTATDETDRLYRAWDACREARGECYYVTLRRQGLARLKSYLDKMEEEGLVGNNAWLNGDMPPCVPVWRFRERK
jgi:hypothetical protein